MRHAQSAQMWQAGQIYFTLVSAYLIVGYLAGANLNRAQAGLVTSLYLIWMANAVVGRTSAGETCVRLQLALTEMGSLAVDHINETFLTMLAFSLAQFVGVVASL